MGVIDSCYLFTSKKVPRRAIVWGIYEMIHAEATWTLNAEIDVGYGATPGEFLGFKDVDGEFRLFEIDTAENDDDRGVTVIMSTDAAVTRLTQRIGTVRLTGVTAEEAVTKAIAGTGFVLGRVTAGTDRRRDVGEYYETKWKILRGIAQDFNIRVIPRCVINPDLSETITVDVLKKENAYRGRLIEGVTDTSAIYVKKENAPITRMYATGKPIGEEDPPSCVTIKDVVWSKEKGDPADKPSGQTYIIDEEAEAEHGRRDGLYSDKNEEDPKKLMTAAWSDLQARKRPHVAGAANVTDMEMIGGYSHKKIRLYDKVYVRTRCGEDAEAVIVDVRRNYLRPARTKILLGEETDSASSASRRRDIVSQVAGLTQSARRSGASGAAAANRYIETRQLIQLNANTIQLNAEELVEINARLTQINGDLKVLGRLQAQVAEFDSMLSGDSTVTSLNVQNLKIAGRSVYLKTVYVDGTPHQLLAYGIGD
ncbi:MAG: phage tail protein [Clostridia bacterium]|nr:phage tail protein [Clostridia bacterium]